MSKAMQRALGVQLGLEDGDATPELSEAASENAAISEGAVEVADATDEVVADDQAATELSEAHEKLEEVSEAIEQSEVVSKEAAVFMHLAIKNACGRFYGPAFAQAVPSVESFSGDSGRRRNTQIALEGIGQMLRTFWDAIMKQIKKMWASIKNWYLRVLDAAPRLKKKAESLAAKSSNLTGAPEEKSFDLGQLRQLHINGKAPDPGVAKTMVKNLGILADGTLGNTTSGQYEGLFDDFEKHLEGVADIGDDKVKSISKLGGADGIYGAKHASNPDLLAITKAALRFTNEVNKVKLPGNGAVEEAVKRYGDDVTVVGSDELFGGRQFVAKTSKLKEQDDTFTLNRVLRNSGIVLADFKAKPKDVDTSGSFKTLNSGDIRTICDEVADICDHIMTYKKAWEARDKQHNKMDEAAKKAINAVEKDKDAPSIKARVVKDVASGLAGAFQLGARAESMTINYLLSVARSLLVWVEASMAQYK